MDRKKVRAEGFNRFPFLRQRFTFDFVTRAKHGWGEANKKTKPGVNQFRVCAREIHVSVVVCPKHAGSPPCFRRHFTYPMSPRPDKSTLNRTHEVVLYERVGPFTFHCTEFVGLDVPISAGKTAANINTIEQNC